MQKQPSYHELVELITSVPKREPKPIPPQDPSWKEKLRIKMATRAQDAVKDTLMEMHRVTASLVIGTRVLNERVPIAHVPTVLAAHLNNFSAVSWELGKTPFTVHVTSRYDAVIDWYGGRVLHLKSRLFVPVDLDEQTRSAIIVESGDMPEPNPFTINTNY